MRPGVGRPRVTGQNARVMVAVRLPTWLHEWMRRQDLSQSELIENALRNSYGAAPKKSRM